MASRKPSDRFEPPSAIVIPIRRLARVMLAGLMLTTMVLSTMMLSPRFTYAAEGAAPAQQASENKTSDKKISDYQAQAREILEATGIQGGLIVHLGCGDGQLTAALRANDSYLVHGLDRDAALIQRARARLRQEGNYGSITVDRLSGDSLPYVDQLVNLVVAEAPLGVSREEVMRVLAPRGVAYLKQDGQWVKTVKPRPEQLDEWTHFLHDASGNAVAHDDVVGPPRHLQWVGSPRWSRHHDRMASMSALVSSGGRVFYIMDEGSRVSIQLAPKWKLIARDAFNGTILWKQPIATWHSHLWPLKSGPTQLARRLVASGDSVYVTLGIDAPLVELDAATGQLHRTFEGTDGTEEVILHDGKLFLQVNESGYPLADYLPKNNVGDQGRVANEFHWDKQPRRLMAFEAESGRRLWNTETVIAPLTIAADARGVYFHNGQAVVSLDGSTGEQRWAAPAPLRDQPVTMNFGPRVVLYGDVVLFAGGDRKMQGLASEDGKQLWMAPHDKSAYSSPEDLLVAGGLVWSAPTTRTADTGTFTGRNPLTGEVKSEFSPDVDTYWFHHRCHMAKATDRFLMPSRTGIEFVDVEKQDWNTNHWVRGGCLYGVMPCNGLVYAPPHDCACYPETKLFGLNALAPESAGRRIDEVTATAADRLEQGPAFGKVPTDRPAAAGGANENDSATAPWPTYRHDPARSGHTTSAVPSELAPAWKCVLGGRLTALTAAEGQVYVAQIDEHTLHALNANSGQQTWSFTAGGRIDSPPTYDRGALYFGSADGWVYCLRASDGSLAWRFRGAPRDLRLPAYEQLESVWPVHGSVLVEEGIVSFVAGRSNFLDGGLRLYRLEADNGAMLSETVIDEREPDTGEDVQSRIQVLNMPVGLPDVLSSDGEYVYMRSQRFDREGKRLDLGPHSGNPAEQGSSQHGVGSHLFAPMGYLDDTWFHRSYWVFGQSFAGGHAGYYQAGKYAPSGRILVFDDANVYGFGRLPEYYKWTTILEHQLFSASKIPPPAPKALRRGGSSQVQIQNSESLDPSGKSLAVMAWAKATKPEGTILARGGPSRGYALVIRSGKPRFVVRIKDQVYSTGADKMTVGRWAHLTGVLQDKQIKLYVDGKLASSAKVPGLLEGVPLQGTEVGADDGGPVGEYRSPLGFTGLIDEVQIYHGPLTDGEIQSLYADKKLDAPLKAQRVLSLSFDKAGQAGADSSGQGNHGKVTGALPVEGKAGTALQFEARPSRRDGSLVKHHWNARQPLLVRAMTLAGETLFIAGPPDLVDEQASFQQLAIGDEEIQADLARQEAALEGAQGGILRAVSAKEGSVLADYHLDALPVWDGMAAAPGQLYLSTADGNVLCFEGKQ
jgi:outer membrane protein assembly factor BamB